VSNHDPRYLPSESEIREATAAIRAGWSERTHRERAGFDVSIAVVPLPIFVTSYGSGGAIDYRALPRIIWERKPRRRLRRRPAAG
jgi:hypothetical protein